MKLIVNSGDTVSVYVVDNVPIVIEAAERLYPTVCALWKVPDLVPVLTVHSPVLPKVSTHISMVYYEVILNYMSII